MQVNSSVDEGMKKDIPCKQKSKENQGNFKPKTVKRYKEGYYTMINISIHQEDIQIINIYVLNIEAHKHINQILIDMKGEINNTIIVANLNTPLLKMSRSTSHKEILNVNHALEART